MYSIYHLEGIVGVKSLIILTGVEEVTVSIQKHPNEKEISFSSYILAIPPTL